jgi:UDP-N-acetylmuramoyl-tripeptide--D-alanyl-D-alanine ligase
MLELGEKSATYHQALAAPLRDAGTDLIFTMGKEMRALADILSPEVHAGHAENTDALLTLLKRTLLPGDVVLVKGSNSMGLNVVVDGLKAAPPPAAGGGQARYAL